LIIGVANIINENFYLIPLTKIVDLELMKCHGKDDTPQRWSHDNRMEAAIFLVVSDSEDKQIIA
jgi:hypothetical protein